MKKKTIILLSILFGLSLILLISADWTPQENINLRDYYNITNVPYYNGTNINITGLYYGNASQLTNIPTGTESDPYWALNYTTFLTHVTWSTASNGTLMFASNWNATNTSYYLVSNPFGFYNSTVFDYTDYLLSANWNATNTSYYLVTNPFGFYNSTDFSISNYFTKTNILGFNYWNSTFATFNKTYADTLYSTISEPLWGGNYSTFLTVSGWNDSGLIQDWNATGYIIDWSYVNTWDTSWLANWTAYNDTWTSTDSEIWSVASNGTFALINEPYWTGNYTAYNDSWTSTYNDSYVPYTGATSNLDLGANNFSVDTSVLFVDSNNNRVGIGTSSPDSAFHIKANIAGSVGSHPAGQIIIQNPADSVTSNVVITAYESDGSGDPDQQLWYLGSSSSSNSNIILLNRRNALLQFGTNDTTQMTILGNGNVGIGTFAPTHKLNVVGDANITGLIYGNGSQLTDVSGAETTWKANYSGYLVVAGWNDSGLIQDWNASGWITDQSGTTSDATWVANWTAYNSTWSAGATWNANFTNMVVDCPAGNYSYGMYPNGTWQCRNDISGAAAETDPYWGANYTAYNDSWTTTDAEIQAAELDPKWSANYTAYNDSWTSTDSEIWGVCSNSTFANIDEPLWSGNYSAYNTSWTTDTNTWDVSWVANWTAYNSSWSPQTETDPIFAAWDNFTGIPHATPSNGDVTHFSWADEIYDWAVGLFLQSIVTDTSPQLGGYLDTNSQNIGSTSDEIENIYVGDTTRIYFGDGQDSSIYYNGTTLIISG